MTKSETTSRTRQKFNFGMEPNITTLLPTCLYIIAMHLVCCCSLPVLRRSVLKKGTRRDLVLPRPLPSDGSGRKKTTTFVWNHEYFIPTKFNQAVLEKKSKMGTFYGRTEERRTDRLRTTGYDNSSLKPSVQLS